MGRCRASSKFSSWDTSVLSFAVVIAVLSNQCFGEPPQLVNPNDGEAMLDPSLDQFWAFPVGRAGYPLSDSPPGVPPPGQFPGSAQPGATAPGGATFYPGPVPGTVQVGYFSGPSIASSFPPGSYGFNGNGVFGFNIPANAIVQQQQQQQQQQSANQHSNWGGFWSRFNPANRVGSLFNFSQRQPVHQYQFSASITNQNNRQQNNPQSPQTNNPGVASQPYFFPQLNPQSDYKPWYNAAGFLPFGNPYFFSQQNPPFPPVNNGGYHQNSDQSNADNVNKPSFPAKPSIPVYNTPNVPNNSDESNGSQSNTTSDNSSSGFNPNPPIRTVSPTDNTRQGLWGESLRRNWLQVPWIANFANRDGTPRTDYPGATLFSLQG